MSRIDLLELDPNTAQPIYIKGVGFPLMLTKQVFKNKDGSSSVLYFVSSDTNLTYDQITTIYQKQWNVELFHKSVKSNTALAKSPTRTVRTQINYFALRAKLYIHALKSNFTELRELSA